MTSALNYQLSIFGKFLMPPSPELITSLMSKINQETGLIFLPNIINNQRIDFSEQRINSITNFGFISADQVYNIVILNDRIDVNFNKTSDVSIEMREFYSMAEKALGVIMQHSELSSNRMAINIQMISDLRSADMLSPLGKKLIKTADYYKEQTCHEWSTRVNSQAHIELQNKKEGINVITDITSPQYMQEQQSAVLYHIDINTLPANTDMRFNSNYLNPFIANTMPIAERIITDVERLIKND